MPNVATTPSFPAKSPVSVIGGTAEFKNCIHGKGANI
jgi:hypothetical protein